MGKTAGLSPSVYDDTRGAVTTAVHFSCFNESFQFDCICLMNDICIRFMEHAE